MDNVELTAINSILNALTATQPQIPHHWQKLPILLYNLWDDYYDDGFVPQNKKQETNFLLYNHTGDNALVGRFGKGFSVFGQTEYPGVTDKIASGATAHLLGVLQEIRSTVPEFKNVVFKLSETSFDAIIIENITHINREILVEALNAEPLIFQNQYQYYFISES
jgi:hypothetical protein